MKASVITRAGAPEVLEVRDWPDPEPKEGEVRIRTRFAGVNFADIAARIGIYPDAPPIPCVIGYEVSGTIEKLGPGVDPKALAVGDRVFAPVLFGGYAELCVARHEAVRKLPEGMSDEEGAAISVNYLTAYHMLHYLTVVRPGDKVLIHAAAGGVGIAAIQMAKACGAEIIGTASGSKHEFLRSIGVTHCIDYTKMDFEAEVKSITQGEGVDIVLDALGGSALAKSYRCLGVAGRLFSFGFSRATPGEKRSLITMVSEYWRMPRFNPLDMIGHNRAVLGVNMNHVSQRPRLVSQELDGLIDLYKKGVARPRVDKVFPLAEASAAHRFIQDRKNIGKVLLKTT